jgi:sugar lactone lactonase YvrE
MPVTKTIDSRRIECVVRSADQLGETPLWDERGRKLWWLDVEQPKLQSFDPASGSHTAQPFATAFLGSHALGEDGSQLLALDLELRRQDQASRVTTPFARIEQGLDNRLNDGRVDARGRFWIGTMDNQLHRPNGSLYRVDPDGRIEKIFGGVVVSNGIAFSPDNKVFYFTDTRRYTTWRFRFDLEEGRVFERQVFADYTSTGERPDGACVDVDGGIWTAFFAGSRIVRYRPDGTIDVVVPVPVSNPTCVCFGGADMRTLYITTASKFLTPEQREREPLAGSVLAIHGVGQGLLEHRFRFTQALPEAPPPKKESQ